VKTQPAALAWRGCRRGGLLLASARGQVPLLVRHLGRTDYQQTWQAMVAFTAART
jgi:hypothetical protein